MNEFNESLDANVSSTDREHRTALHYAAMDGDVEAVDQLIEAGSNVNAADDGGYTPLHFAAQYLRSEVITLLIAHGASLEAEDRWGNTPLWRATFSTTEDGAAVMILLQAGADPLHENRSGNSPISLARKIANYPTARLFAHLP